LNGAKHESAHNNSNDAVDLNNSQHSINSNDLGKDPSSNLFDPDNAVDIPSSTKGRVSTPKKQKDAGIGKETESAWDVGFDIEEKNCDACTMLNPLYATICSVCGTSF